MIAQLIFRSRIPLRGYHFGAQEFRNSQIGRFAWQEIVSHWLRAQRRLQNPNHQIEETRSAENHGQYIAVTTRKGVEGFVGVVQ